MKKLTWTEIFYSLQGEGVRMGVPSLFIRLFGCNFTCDGFSMPPKELSTERFGINPKKYKKFEDIPLVSTGCDSFSSWDSRFRKFSTKGSVSQMLEQCVRTALDKSDSPSKKEPLKGLDVVMTGGEPLLKGQQTHFPELFQGLQHRGVDTFTFETNGTQEITPKFGKYLEDNAPMVIWSISPKLPESGNCMKDSIIPEAVKSMFDAPNSEGYFKFVISRHKSIKHVEMALKKYKKAGIELPVYLMPVGGLQKEYDENKKNVAQACLNHRWNYSARLHIDLFGNNWGT